MNGDIGIIKKIDTDQDGEKYVIVSFDDNDVLYTKS